MFERISGNTVQNEERVIVQRELSNDMVLCEIQGIRYRIGTERGKTWRGPLLAVYIDTAREEGQKVVPGALLPAELPSSSSYRGTQDGSSGP